MDIYDASKGVFFGTQPTPEDLKNLAAKGVKTIVNLRLPEEDQPELPLDRAEAEAEAAGLMYLHVPISSQNFTDEAVAEVTGALRNANADGSAFVY